VHRFLQWLEFWGQDVDVFKLCKIFSVLTMLHFEVFTSAFL
jgi:hypothetical protein